MCFLEMSGLLQSRLVALYFWSSPVTLGSFLTSDTGWEVPSLLLYVLFPESHAFLLYFTLTAFPLLFRIALPDLLALS